jgi:hypothetical protein
MTGVRTSAGSVDQIGRQLPAGEGDEDDEEGRRRERTSVRVWERLGCMAKGASSQK